MALRLEAISEIVLLLRYLPTSHRDVTIYKSVADKLCFGFAHVFGMVIWLTVF